MSDQINTGTVSNNEADRPAAPVAPSGDPRMQPDISGLTDAQRAALNATAAQPGATSLEDRMRAAERYIADHESRLLDAERALGLAEPLAKEILDMIPGGAAAEPMIAAMPQIVATINDLINTLNSHFGGKLETPPKLPLNPGG